MNAWLNARLSPNAQRSAAHKRNVPEPLLTLGVVLSYQEGADDALGALLAKLQSIGWERSRLSWTPDWASSSAAHLTVVLSASRSSNTGTLRSSTREALRTSRPSSSTYRLTHALLQIPNSKGHLASEAIPTRM